MLTCREYYKILMFTLIIISIIIIQFFISEKLHKVSFSLIEYLQSFPSLIPIMNYVTALGSIPVKSFLLVYIFSTCNLYHTFLYTVVCYSSIFVTEWLKLNLQEPRPFWLDDKIRAYSCESGFGYPSNHVMTTVPSYFMFFEIMYYNHKLDKSTKANLYYWLGFSFIAVLCVIIGMSRMVLGVHSLDQVFFGLLMGFACYYFYLNVIDYEIKDFRPFLKEITNPVYRAKLFLIVIGAYVVFLINGAMLDIRYESIWTDRIIKECGKLPATTPFYKCIFDSGDYLILYGVLLGIFYDLYYNYNFKYDSNNIPFEYIDENLCDTVFTEKKFDGRIGKWNDTPTITTIIRTALLFLCFSLFFITKDIIMPFMATRSFMELYMIEKFIPNAIGGFLTFGFGKKVCYYLNLTNLPKGV